MATPEPTDSSQVGVRAKADKAATPLKKNASPSPKKRKHKEAPSESTDSPLLKGSKAVSGPASKRLKAAAKASSARRKSTVLSAWAQKRRPTSALANGVAQLDKKEQAEVSSLAVHRGRFASWSPSAVSAGAASQDGTVAAICRENGDIEIWDAVNWKVLQTIPGRDDVISTAAEWVQDRQSGQWRLLTGGVDGMLVEWDLHTLLPKASSPSYGGASWALAVQPQQSDKLNTGPSVSKMAVACDDGVVRFFTVEEGVPGAQYERSCAAVEGRVLCLAWHPNGSTLFSGHSDATIRAWDASTGRELYRINAGAGTGGTSCIWALAVLPDGQLVSGGAEGHVQFWDSTSGTLTQGFRRHEASVLTLAASPNGDIVFAAGIDEQLVMLRKITGKDGATKWSYVDTKRPHTHDIRVLLVLARAEQTPMLLSAGNDTQLVLHKINRFNKEHPRRVCRVPQPPLIAAPAAGIAPQAEGEAVPDSAPTALITAQGSHVDVWRIKLATRQQMKAGSSGHAAEPEHMAQISTGGHVIAVGATADGRYLAYSTATQTRLLELVPADGPLPPPVKLANVTLQPRAPPPTIKRHQLPASVPAAHKLCLVDVAEASASQRAVKLLIISSDGTLSVYGVESQELEHSFSAATLTKSLPHSFAAKLQARQALHQAAPLVSATAVSCSSRLLALTFQKYVILIDLGSMKVRGHFSLAPDGSTVTALAFNAGGTMLAAATAAGGLVTYQVATRRVAPWFIKNSETLAERMASLPASARELSFSPDLKTDTLLIHSGSAYCMVDTRKSLGPPPSESGGKKRRRYRMTADTKAARTASGQNFVVRVLNHPCLVMRFVAPGAVAMLEQPWSVVYSQLQAPLYRHRYGT